MFEKVDFPESTNLMQMKKISNKKETNRARVQMNYNGLTFNMGFYIF